jgi:hypothetical protein
VTTRTLSARLGALEARGPAADGPLIIEIVVVGARDGRPDGTRTDWDAHSDAVVVGGKRYAVGADETAHQAVERIVADMCPQPHGVVALVARDGPA